jgi:hypothetical protein
MGHQRQIVEFLHEWNDTAHSNLHVILISINDYNTGTICDHI